MDLTVAESPSSLKPSSFLHSNPLPLCVPFLQDLIKRCLAVSKCTACGADSGAFVRWYCRNCGDIFRDKCTHGRITLTAKDNAQPMTDA
ncbi:protein FREE1-like isoform X2 [Carex rostrata]